MIECKQNVDGSLKSCQLSRSPFSQATGNLPSCFYGQLYCAALCTDFLNFPFLHVTSNKRRWPTVKLKVHPRTGHEGPEGVLQPCSLKRAEQCRLTACWKPKPVAGFIPLKYTLYSTDKVVSFISLKAKLNPSSHLLPLLGAHHIFHVSGFRFRES
jgi:hypothetical protein